MVDVATLGLQVDSAPVDKGSRSLDKLSASARKAETATERMNGATGAATAALNSEAAAASKASAAIGAHGRAARSANDNMRGFAKSSSLSAASAAQLQDTFVTATAGMTPFVIGLQQGTQWAGQMQMAMQSGASAVDVMKGAVFGLLSPISLLFVGITALIAAGIQMVDWAKTGQSALNAIANVLPKVADEAAIVGAALALAFGPAIVRSVISLSAALAGSLVGALRAVAAAALANPFTALVVAIGVAVTALYVFRDEVQKAIGVDVIGVVKTAVNTIIGAFVGAFEAIEAVWSSLPGVLGDIVYTTANTVIAGIEMMVNKAIQAMKSLLGSLSALPGPLKAGLGLTEGLLSNIGEVDLGRIENPHAGAVGNAAIDAFGAYRNAQGADYVGQIGEAISAGASAASGKLKELAKSVGELGTEEDKAGAKAAKRYDAIVQDAESAIAANKAERDALFLTEEAALKLRYTTDLLNKAREAGINLTAGQRAELEGLAGQMASTEVATQRTADAINSSRSIFQGFFSDINSGIQQGKGFWESFAQAGINAINKIADKLIDFASQQLFDQAFLGLGSSFSGGSGGGGGFFGSLLGGLGSILGFASGGYTGDGAANAVAGAVHKGEYVFSKQATSRIGVGNLERMHNAARNGGANDNQGGGTSIVRIELGDGLKADILQDAASQSIKIVHAASGETLEQANAQAAGAVARRQNQGGGDWRLG